MITTKLLASNNNKKKKKKTQIFEWGMLNEVDRKLQQIGEQQAGFIGF